MQEKDTVSPEACDPRLAGHCGLSNLILHPVLMLIRSPLHHCWRTSPLIVGSSESTIRSNLLTISELMVEHLNNKSPNDLATLRGAQPFPICERSTGSCQASREGLVSIKWCFV